MSLTYIQTIAAGSTLEDCVDNAASSQLCLILNNGFKIFNINTGGQVGSTVTTTNSTNHSVCLINSASACVFPNTTNMDLIELTSGFFHNYSGTVAVANAQTGQQSVGDPTNSIAVAVTNSTAKISVFTGSTFTGSNLTIGPISNLGGVTTCVTLKNAGRFLVGSNVGLICEIDSAGNVYKQILLPQRPNANYISTQDPIISGLSFDGTDYLAVSTTCGNVYVYAYNTATLLYTIPFGGQGTGTLTGTAMCIASSGTVFLGYNYTSSTNVDNVIGELDFTTAPARIRDVLFTGANTAIYATGCQNAVGWVLQGNNVITFTCSSRNTDNIASTVQNPSGTNVSARTMRLIDNGVGTAVIDVDTYIAGQATLLPVVSGQSVIELSLINSGINTLCEISRYSS